MCWLTESYHICSHWGPRKVHTACARGESSKSVTGCWDNIILGVAKQPLACPSCIYRAEMEITFQVSHVLHDSSSSEGEFEPAANKERRSSEGSETEWVEDLEVRWEANWIETKEAVRTEEEAKHKHKTKNSRHGKWCAWRYHKSTAELLRS
ncbi:hypothetical protein ONS95_007348 [Cadophora gregata]|uniref:uncharacterized protein n=1 Tax=Cadophora gregata TaxID=51156 RepID=UPI0026DC3C9E|nr:uncharacterized protein ONS95_007348 [Cadophora gregata]KAK0100904.1 hypothetical protein ONS95_007348 [Cadophora gregata]KAK0117102.1 hypothetical protein ONS96_012938 [Cadophora gregata f. sp. sojae]